VAFLQDSLMPPFTRRAFVIASGATLVSMLAGCGSSSPDDGSSSGGGNSDEQLSAASFRHGVASGDPLPDAVMLWTRALPLSASDTATRVRYRIATDALMTNVVTDGIAGSSADRDWTIKLDLRDLQPDHSYYYQFESASELSPIGRTRTAPSASVDRLRLVFVTCANYVAGYFHAYRRVAERNDLHAVVHLGDYIYENGTQDQVRPHVPANKLITLSDYRARYAQYREDDDLVELHRQHPMIWVWDDHEVSNNAWRGGAEGHDPTTDGDYATRRKLAMQAAFEWLPIRAPDASDPSRVWRGFKFGDLADLTMIDARHFGRDEPLAPNTLFGDTVPVFTETGAFADEKRQILGATQEAWLATQLATNTAKWQLIGNQIYLSPLKLVGAPRALGGGGLYLSNDKWDGYDPARARVMQMIGKRDNVVVLTGDAHEAYAFELTDDPNGLGYNALTGSGASAVEFVATSITSRGDQPVGDSATAIVTRTQAQAEQLLRVTNPHLKYYQNTLNGYVLLDVTPERVQAEFWMVPMVTQRTDEQALNSSFTVASGSSHLVAASGASIPISSAPLPAP
jgi:alkaline phosphatase D